MLLEVSEKDEGAMVSHLPIGPLKTCYLANDIATLPSGPVINTDNTVLLFTGPDGAVVMSSANGLVGTGFSSRYRLEPRACF